MSLIAAKYFEDKGWIVVKNEDRTYKPIMRLRKSFRKEVERLYCWNDFTKFAEGINEFGIAIIHSDIAVKDDDLQGAKQAKEDSSIEKELRRYYSPIGLRIRTAMFEKTVYDTAKKLIELEITGNVLIADRKTCLILEGAYIQSESGEEYAHKIKDVPTDHIVVRTNHGVLLPWTGYSMEIPEQKEDRLSSEARRSKAEEGIIKAKTADQFLDACSDKSNKDPQMNPLRIDETQKSVRTTSQIVIVPKDMTLFFRPIWCNIVVDLETINNKDEKTFFEVISARKLLRMKDVMEMKDFREYLGK